MNQPRRLALSVALLSLSLGGIAPPLLGSDAKSDLANLSALPLLTPGAGEGDYQIKPPFAAAPEQTPQPGVPKGRIIRFSLTIASSKFYPNTGLKDTKVARAITLYLPAHYVPGTPAPLLLTHDAMGSGNNQLAVMLDNLIAAHRVPALVALMVPSGGGNGGGSERGLEYDTVSGKYAEFIEAEVLPKIAHDYHVAITSDPDGRAVMGGSSGGAAAFSMAWFHPDLYRRVLTYSGTYKNNQSPQNPALPHGAWEYHEHLIPQNAAKPLRVWLEVGGNDHGATDPDEMHNTIVANVRMAAALKAKGYHYQFVYAEGANHVDKKVVAHTLPQALEWLWQGYRPAN
jgi:enterochelin esterase family protein